MNPIYSSHLTRRIVGVLAGVIALLAPLTSEPAAFASQLRPDPPWWITHPVLPGHLPSRPPGCLKHPQLPDPAGVHAGLAGGMPGWLITVIAVGAAVIAVAAIVLGRGRAQFWRSLTYAHNRGTTPGGQRSEGSRAP